MKPFLPKSNSTHWFEQLGKATLFAFDTETTSLDYSKAEIVGVSFAVRRQAAYVPLAHDYPGAPEQLDRYRDTGTTCARCWKTRTKPNSART